jgi:hypothetical protein
MALNTKIALYRGVEANLSALASTGQAGVLALATDTNALYIDQGSGTAGIGNPGSGKAWIRSAAGTQVFTASSQAAQIALSGAMTGDICVRTDINQVFMLTAFVVNAYATFANWTQIGVLGTAIQGLSSGTAHQWVAYVDTSGVQHLSQPAFADVSGSIAQTQLPATIGAGSSLTLVDCGTF